MKTFFFSSPPLPFSLAVAQQRSQLRQRGGSLRMGAVSPCAAWEAASCRWLLLLPVVMPGKLNVGTLHLCRWRLCVSEYSRVKLCMRVCAQECTHGVMLLLGVLLDKTIQKGVQCITRELFYR